MEKENIIRVEKDLERVFDVRQMCANISDSKDVETVVAKHANAVKAVELRYSNRYFVVNKNAATLGAIADELKNILANYAQSAICALDQAKAAALEAAAVEMIINIF